jgi:predicted metal-dependent enzyme (double-stranded beta helix superfamily)
MRILFLALTFVSYVLTQSFAAEAPVDTKHTILVTSTKVDVYRITVDDKGTVVKIDDHKTDSGVKVLKSNELTNINEDDLKKSVFAALKEHPSQGKEGEVATLGKYDKLDSTASGAIGVVSTVGGLIGSFAPKIAELAAPLLAFL